MLVCAVRESMTDAAALGFWSEQSEKGEVVQCIEPPLIFKYEWTESGLLLKKKRSTVTTTTTTPTLLPENRFLCD